MIYLLSKGNVKKWYCNRSNAITVDCNTKIAIRIEHSIFTFRRREIGVYHFTPHTHTYTQLSLSARTYRSAGIAQGIAWSLSYVLLHEILVGLHNVPKIFLKKCKCGSRRTKHYIVSKVSTNRPKWTFLPKALNFNNYDRKKYVCYYALFCPFILKHCSLFRLCLIFTGFKKKKTEKLQSLL